MLDRCALFVSKRLQKLAAALVCLMLVQLAVAVVTHKPPNVSGATRVTIQP